MILQSSANMSRENPMNTTVISTPEIPGDEPESDAASVLAEVAKSAIDETAERIEALVRATAEMEGMRGELGELREAFRAHVEGNQVDFIAVKEKLTLLEAGMAVMHEALEAEADATEELLREEIREELAGEVETEIPEAASVVEALGDEPHPPEHHDETHAVEQHEHTRRRFLTRI
jgi:hypothetical protein